MSSTAYTLTSTSNTIVTSGTAVYTPSTIYVTGNSVLVHDGSDWMRLPDDWRMPDDWTGKIVLPDGAVVHADRGKVRIEDKDAKVTYRGCAVREFNKFLNASDLLEEFVQFLGRDVKLSGPEALSIPVEMFISWLVVRAAEEDGEDVEPTDRLRLTAGAHLLRRPRCRCCGRFISRTRARNGVLFCSGEHQEKWLSRKDRRA